jgi:hypothetical protein
MVLFIIKKEPFNGHWPFLRPVNNNDKWENHAFQNLKNIPHDGSFEVIGKKIQNKYCFF